MTQALPAATSPAAVPPPLNKPPCRATLAVDGAWDYRSVRGVRLLALAEGAQVAVCHCADDTPTAVAKLFGHSSPVKAARWMRNGDCVSACVLGAADATIAAPAPT